MTNPLFVEDLPTLKALLRLSGTPSAAADTLAIIDEAILKARLAFYRRLGEQRVSSILATAFDENPTSEASIIRALANTVEVKLCYVELLRRLPNQFMDASGDANRRWNEEAPFRERTPSSLKEEVLLLQDEIEEDMQMLALEESLADESSYKVFDGTPACPPPRPGDSIRGINRKKLSQD